MKKILLLIACTITSACGSANTSDSLALDEWTSWTKDVENWYIGSDSAVLKAVDYRYIPIGSQIYVINSEQGYELSLTDTKSSVLSAKLEPDVLSVNSKDGVVEFSYAELPSRSIAISETQRLRFNLENITHTEKRVRAILYNDLAPALGEFPGLTFFPYDAAGVVTATFEADPNMPEIILDTERGMTKAFYRAGFAGFTLGDDDYKMPLYTGSNEPAKIDYFFTGFVDATTGRETYGTGRYLSIEDFGAYPPKVLNLDYNYAYNPYCARSDAYNCPVIDFVIGAPMRFGETYVDEQ